MNTNTVDPEAPTTEQPDRRPEPSFGYDPQRPALRRPFEGRMLAGVAEGLGRYFGVDTTIVRIAGGAGIPLYLAGLLLIPDEGSDQSLAGSIVESFQNRSR